MNTRQWLFSTLKSFRSSIFQLLAIGLVLAGLSAVLPILLQRLVDAALAGDGATGQLWLYVTFSLVSAVPIIFVLRNRLADRYEQFMRQQAFEHNLRQDLSYFEDRESSVVTIQVSKGISGSSRLMLLFSNGDLLVDVPLAIFAAVYIGRESLLALGLLVLFLVIFAVTARYFGGQLSSIEKKYNEIDTDLSAKQREAVQHAAAVRTHNASGLLAGHSYRESMRALSLQHRSTWVYSVFYLLGGGGHRVAEAVVLVVFLPYLQSQTITPGTFLALIMYAGYVVSPADFVGTMYATIKQAWANILPLHAIMQVQPTVVESSHPLTMQPVRNAIEMRNVTFGYGTSSEPLLKNFSLSIPAGTVTAIVGLSGVGKSTIARLLLRLYDTQEGVVQYDGTDVRHLSFASMSGQIAYLSQEVTIFSGTIRENVGFGRSAYSTEEVIAALHKASASFVFQLPDGIDTEIGESGKKLSGGEKQRIAIARLFMGNPSVLILDEATSALDNQAEREITTAFDTLVTGQSNMTIVVIAHRLSTIENADQIVVMNSGGIEAIGTHVDLLGSSSLYQQLHGKAMLANT